MRTNCPYCGVEVEVDVEGFNEGEELQTKCPECGRDFEFTVVKESASNATGTDFYYLDDNNNRIGPVSIELLMNVINGSTLVWKEGMSDWEKACDVPELKAMIKSVVPPPIPEKSPAVKAIEPPQQEEPEYQPIKPDTNMTMAILCTLCCCVPLGVCAIYYAAKVDKSYYQGNYDEAEEYSSKAKSWTYWGIGIGLIFEVIYFVSLLSS